MTNSNKVKLVAEIGMALALAFLLSFVTLFQMPQGGSVTFQMVPIIFIAFRWGFGPGVLAGVAFGLLKLITGPFIIHWVQFLLDYPVAFAGLGLAGVVKPWVDQSKNLVLSVLLGSFLGGALRFLAHFVAGGVFFGDLAPEGQNPWIYSLVYNSTYMVPEIILTAIIIAILIASRPHLITYGNSISHR